MVQEALASGQTPYDIYATEKYVDDRALKPFYDKITQISESVSEHLSDTETPQGIFAVMPRQAGQLPDPLSGQFLLLDAIQDPEMLEPWCGRRMLPALKPSFLVMEQPTLLARKFCGRCKAANFTCASYRQN